MYQQFSAEKRWSVGGPGAFAPEEGRSVSYDLLVSGDGNQKQQLHTGPFVGWLALVSIPAGIFAQISKGSATLTLIVVALMWAAGAVSYLGYTKLTRAGRVGAYAMAVLLSAGAVALIVLSDSGGGAPSSPTTSFRSSTPSAAATTTTPTTTTATTTSTSPTLTPPIVLPPRPPDERELVDGTAGEFFDRDLIIGTGGASANSSSFNLTTRAASCTYVTIRLGEQKQIVGRRGRAMTFFRVTLLRVGGTTSTIRVEETPTEDWPGHVSYSGETIYDQGCP